MQTIVRTCGKCHRHRAYLIEVQADVWYCTRCAHERAQAIANHAAGVAMMRVREFEQLILGCEVSTWYGEMRAMDRDHAMALRESLNTLSMNITAMVDILDGIADGVRS